MSQKSGYSDLGDWDYQRRQSAWAGLVLSIGSGTQRRKNFNNKEQDDHSDYISDAKPFCWAVQINGVTGRERRWRVIPGCHCAFAPAVTVWGTFLLSTSHFPARPNSSVRLWNPNFWRQSLLWSSYTDWHSCAVSSLRQSEP